MYEIAAQEWVRYSTLEAWERELGIPAETLRQRLHGVCIRTGTTGDGSVANCYAESDVRRACSDLIR
ncbi:MAG: hypothetical protein ACRC33_28415 [Gemmataceae bacterium]